MKSTKRLIIPVLAFCGALPIIPASVQAAAKDPKPAIISLKSADSATSSATSTLKVSKKQQDPLVALMETLASSIDKVSLQIDTLQKQGADTGAAEGLIFDARLRLHTVELSLNPVDASSTATTTAATSTAQDIKKAKDDTKKKAVDDLKIAYADILNAIKALKKTIITERSMIDGSADDSAAASTTAATTTDLAATSTADSSSAQ